MILTVENTELEYSRVLTAKETGQVSDYKERKAVFMKFGEWFED